MALTITQIQTQASSAATTQPGTTVAPQGGQAFALNANGTLPIAVQQGLPGYEWGYDAIIGSNITVTSTTESAGTLVIQCASHRFDGHPVIAEFMTDALVPAAAGLVIVNLFEGSTQLTRLTVASTPLNSTSAVDVPGFARYRFTPTMGLHTYKVTAFQSGGNAVIGVGNGGVSGNPPCYIRFTKV